MFRFLLLFLFPALAAGQYTTFSDHFANSDDYALRSLATELSSGTDTLLGQALDSLREENYAAALERIERVLVIDDQQPLAYCLRGNVHAAESRHRQAFADYDRALALQPDLMFAYQRKGHLHLAREEYDLAYANYELADHAVPDSPVPPFLLGALRLKSNNPIRARKLFEESVARDACYAPARVGVLLQRLLSGRAWKGVRELQDLLDCPELTPAVYALLAETETWSNNKVAAIGHLTSALSLAPDNVALLEERSRLYRAEKQYREALNDLNYAYAARFADQEVISGERLSTFRSRIVHALNYFRFSTGLPEAHLDSYRAYLLALEDSDRDELHRLDRVLIRAGEGDRAAFRYFRLLANTVEWDSQEDVLAEINAVLALDPEITDLYCTRGQLLLEMEDYRGAYNSFRDLERRDRSPVAYKGMAMALVGHGREVSALQLYGQALELDSTDLSVLMAVGDIHFRMGKYGLARTYYERGLDLRPRHASLLHFGAVCAYMEGDREVASERMHRLSETYFRLNPEALNLRGLIRLDADSLDAAYTDFNQVIYLKPDLPDAYINRARVNALRGDLQTALRELNNVIARDPEQVQAYVVRSFVYGKLEAPALAAADKQQAIALGYEYPAAAEPAVTQERP